MALSCWSFYLRFDSDDKDVFKRTLDFALESKLDLAQFSILTPLARNEVVRKAIFRRPHHQCRLVEV